MARHPFHPTTDLPSVKRGSSMERSLSASISNFCYPAFLPKSTLLSVTSSFTTSSSSASRHDLKQHCQIEIIGRSLAVEA